MSNKDQSRLPPKSPLEDPDKRAHSRTVWKDFEDKLDTLKGFQSELSGRLQGATRGSSYANQLELAYDERFGGEQSVKDALFSRHFGLKELVPLLAFGALALLYYTHQGAFAGALLWAQVNVLFLGILAVVAVLGLRALGLLKR